MKVLIVFESIFGNTRQIAEAIAEGLRERSAVDVTLAEVADAPASAEGFDLVVIGGPVHAWGMTRSFTREGAREEAEREHIEPVSKGEGIREWLNRLPDAEGEIRAAAFDSAVKMKWFPSGSAAKPAAARLARHGFHLIADPEHFFVEESHGPLIVGEHERARAWGAALLADAAVAV